jgi:hypothetical protein
MKLLDFLAWGIFLGLGPVLWASGLWLFLLSSLSRPRKIAWAVFLVSLGIAVGYVLPLPSIRNRFLLLLVALPLLAIVDVKLAKSNRRFSFWLRACSFEICTVFGSAALMRVTFEHIISIRRF